MRLNRSLFVLPLLAVVSTSMLHAAQTGVLTCGSTTPIKVSYFDVSDLLGNIGSQSSGAGAGQLVGKLTVHAALQQFGTLAPAVGSSFSSCTLTHNALTFAFSTALLISVDGIAGASSTGTAGAATYTQAIFTVSGVSINGGNDGDSGGDDGGWNRTGNNSD